MTGVSLDGSSRGLGSAPRESGLGIGFSAMSLECDVESSFRAACKLSALGLSVEACVALLPCGVVKETTTWRIVVHRDVTACHTLYQPALIMCKYSFAPCRRGSGQQRGCRSLILFVKYSLRVCHGVTNTLHD